MTSPIWHPFTQHALFPEAIHIERAQGAYLYTKDGRRIIDAIASWWVNVHGHCHPKITAAIRRQAETLDQIIFAGFTHEPAENLARKLIDITGLQHVFFSDSGSTSVEVALKMALGYWANTGRPRHGIVVMENGYHGDTFGGMSVGERGTFNDPYAPLLFDVLRLPFPHAGREQDTVDAFEKILRESRDTIAALILEPLVLGAAGMLMYPPSVLKSLHDLCKKHSVFFIADEVMTGWGRTGTRFSCAQAGVTPDILCLSKGLTSGSLPLAVTLCTGGIFQAFYSTDRRKTFFHSSSYSGNPLACAAALASLELWDEEPVTQRIQAISAYHAKALPVLARHPSVTTTRHTGTIAALDLVTPSQGYLSALGPQLYRAFLDKGLLLRPLGNTIYILPPYCVTTEDLDVIYSGIAEALDTVGCGAAQPAV
ncbi:MAG: adenosylmethionine--8-amino-7-oxononanoate transaminase [Pseudomonadota bacterium]|nr:adenosylmethionine--8-amino-7-oxononanoate transaminase [Pseudomonadota bacterium]